jgi:hypothetical protein
MTQLRVGETHTRARKEKGTPTFWGSPFTPQDFGL